ncbi:MAG TPA: OmpA family protein [Bacillota bacterium]
MRNEGRKAGLGMGRRRDTVYSLPAESMNESVDREDSGSAANLLDKIVLPQAVKLARSGHYPDAENLLLLLVQESGEQPEVYDLLARIQAQQGRYTEAEISWSTALRLDPTNREYQLGLRRIRLQNGMAAERPLRGWLWGIGILLCFVMMGFSARHYLGELRTVRLPVPVFQRISTAPRRIPEETPRDRVQTRDLPQAFAKDLRIPGANVNYRKGQITVVFNTGLFQRGVKLLPGAQASLKNLALQLRPYKNRVLVHVEGHTDNVPMPLGLIYRDNVSLGMQRAVIVVDYLRAQADLPASMFTVSSLGEASLLYPNDSSLNQLRNRTVLIRITPL